MSIATLKRKTTRGGNPRLDPVSGIGAKGFSLNGGYRNIGAVGQFRMVSNVTRTPFRGTQPMGHGGAANTYYDVPCNSGSCCTNGCGSLGGDGVPHGVPRKGGHSAPAKLSAR